MAEFITVYANDKGVIHCPFCDEKHTHGIKGGDGHRLAHCNIDSKNKYYHWAIDEDNEIHTQEEGYIVKFPKNN